MFNQRRILLGVSGGIAIYRSAELVRQFKRQGAEVQVLMTRNATRLIKPLLFSGLSENPVYWRTFRRNVEGAVMPHIDLRRWSEALVVCPATANLIGKFAHGIADDLLSTTYLSAGRLPVIIAPAMNPEMWVHPAVQENINCLRQRGVFIVAPGAGKVACGESGIGRLAPLEAVADALRAALWCGQADLTGRHVVITAGPTQEPIDAARLLTNQSSGKMGYALARAAVARGAKTVLVSGPASLPDPHGCELIKVSSARQMESVVKKNIQPGSIFIGAAAVADFRPQKQTQKKIAKSAVPEKLALSPNPDIIADVAAAGQAHPVIGFAATSGKSITSAQRKLKSKGLHAIIVNNITQANIGFASDDNQVVWLTTKDKISSGKMSKLDLAHWLWDRIITVS